MYKMVVMAKAFPGRTEELARWYDEQHIPDLLQVPGVVSAERLALKPLKMPEGSIVWDFLVTYEFAGEDPMVVMRAMGAHEAAGKIVWSDALDKQSGVSMIAMSTAPAAPGAT